MRRNGLNWKQEAAARGLLMAVSILAFVAPLRAQSNPEVKKPRLVVVSLKHKKLAVVENGKVKKIYRVAVGKSTTPSPAGEFTIVNKVLNPTYYHPGTVIPAGPENPVGSRWIGISQKSFAIHGTNEPDSIGKAASHGCIRMGKEDVEELFTMVEVGDQVEISDGDSAETAQLFEQETAVNDAATGR